MSHQGARAIGASIGTAACLALRTATAADPPPPAAREPAHEPSPKRALPDYEGRPRPADKAEWARWPLRILLAPLWLTSELILRRPIGAATVAAERADLPRKVYDFFTYGPDHKLGFIPVGFVEFNFNPSVGVYLFWNDAFFQRGHDLAVHYEVWPNDWLSGSIRYRVQLSPERKLEMRVEGVRRPDNVFYGIGPDTIQSHQSRFTEQHFEMRGSFQGKFWRSSYVQTTIGLRKGSVWHGAYGADPSLEDAAARGFFPLPYGFDHTRTVPYVRGEIVLDTRASTRTGSGAKLELRAEEAADMNTPNAVPWLRWGAVASGILDVNGHGRLLSLSLVTEMLERNGNTQIPFNELVSLGGQKWMLGSYKGRLLGDSAAMGLLQYDWPVAAWLRASLQAGLGNTFNGRLQGFGVSHLRAAGAFGLTTLSDPPLEAMIGVATETFENGSGVDTIRATLGFPTNF